MLRTVYVRSGKSDLKPVLIKVGISDGISTEVVEGLSEGDQVVTGVNSPEQPGGAPRPANPFGGGGFRRM